MENRDHVLQRINEYFLPLFNLVGGNFIIGGGAICDIISTNSVKRDIDIFFETAEDRDRFRERVEELGFKNRIETSFGVKYKLLNIQLDVTTWEQHEISEWCMNCDFTANSFMLNQDMILYCHTEAIDDCVNGLLNPVNLNANWNTRVLRYVEKGFNPTERMLEYLDDLKFSRELYIDQRIETIDLNQYGIGNKNIYLP
jgi:hypothetical protein